MFSRFVVVRNESVASVRVTNRIAMRINTA
jgi:hypothetical protein